MAEETDQTTTIGPDHGADAHDMNQGAWNPAGSFEEDPVVAQPALYLGGAFAGGLALGALLRWFRG